VRPPDGEPAAPTSRPAAGGRDPAHDHSAPRRWLSAAERADAALYAAIARTPTPEIDRAMRGISQAANYSRLWLGASALLAVAGGRDGRRAAVDGLCAIAVTATVVNVVVKPVARRARPDREGQNVPLGRQVRMPLSSSLPSGHSGSAFAFATAVAATQPRAAWPLRVLAALVAYSRVHTGVHYPGDVLIGSLLGAALARVTLRLRHRA
jgi:membrane-associated phospholipid phosphatase